VPLSVTLPFTVPVAGACAQTAEKSSIIVALVISMNLFTFILQKNNLY